MDPTLGTGISAITVFLQGILSFFSPCVLPLLPIYISYLAGGTQNTDEAGHVQYRRGRMMLNTVFFVLGIGFTFFTLGLGFTAAGQFFQNNRMLFARIGGVIVILFGIYQLSSFSSKFMNREHRLPLQLHRLPMNPAVAFLFGFTFSFAWTPCVGPALTSVLLMASSANTAALGFLLIGVYTLGFIIPFLIVGLFTGTLLAVFKKHQKIVRYTAKIGAALMIIMGILMVTGWMNGITGYLSSVGTSQGNPAQEEQIPEPENTGKEPEEENSVVPAPDFTLTDQFGKEHRLSDYKGKLVLLNFWTTWCTYCREEMPSLEKIYQEYGKNTEDVVILGVANPKTAASPNNQDATEAEVSAFIAKGGYTYPTLMDRTGEIFNMFGIRSFPTTFLINQDGNVFAYIPGMVSHSMLESIVQQNIQ